MARFRTHLKNLNVQVGQIAQDVNRRPPGGLPSDTVSSSKEKEQCNTVALRSGKQLQPAVPVEEEDDEKIEKVSSDPEPLRRSEKCRAKPIVVEKKMKVSWNEQE